MSDGPGITARVAPWNEFDQDALDRSVRRRVFSARRSQIVLCEIRDREFPPIHVHPVDQITVVIRGGAEAIVDGRRVPLSEGRALHVPAGVPHAIRACDGGRADTLTVLSAGGAPAPNLA